MNRNVSVSIFLAACCCWVATTRPLIIWAQTTGVQKPSTDERNHPAVQTLNQKAQGYRGIWYMNQPSDDEYVYKYSGGLGTYCAKHRPFAIYSQEANKTFFCYGGAKPEDNRALLHMVSYFDHATGKLARPTILLDKKTGDAHDNPVISLDDEGYIWIFSTSHGRARPSFIHRSRQPFQIDQFVRVLATRKNDQAEEKPLDNFSYMQIWHPENQGFQAFFTRYNFPAARTLCFMNSQDGETWGRWTRLAAIEEGHYQISGASPAKMATMFNMHPQGKGLNWRTNLYYLETMDQGRTWQTIRGNKVELPLTTRKNPALIHDYAAERKLVYLKDLQFDEEGRPVLLYILSHSYKSGPQDPPRQWAVSRWTGEQWQVSTIAETDHNYNFGELWLESPDRWWLIAPTEIGPQPFNPGGEVAMWQSRDQGTTWKKIRQLTTNSPHNHTYVRIAQQAHPDFVALWADGHGRQPSSSHLFFSDSEGRVFLMPPDFGEASAEQQQFAPIPWPVKDH